MGLGADVGKEAAQTLATAATQVTGTLGTDAADAVSSIVGSVDRLEQTLREQSQEWLAESAAWRELLSKGFSIKAN